MVSTTLSSSSLICSYVSFGLLLIPSSVFFISVIIFFISIWLFFIFSNSLLKTSNFSLCLSILLLTSLIILIINTLNPFSGRLAISTLLSSSSGFIFLVSSFETCSLVASFCLTCCFYFYVSGRLVTFPDLGEVAFCRRCLVCNNTLPSGD